MKVLLIKKVSAWLPIVLSLIVLTTMLIFMKVNGQPVRQSDEGTGAHLFQLWFVVEGLMVSFFAITWLPQKPKEAMFILSMQIVAVLAACAPVFYLKL